MYYPTQIDNFKNEKPQSSACQEQFLTAAHGDLALQSLVGSQCAYPSRNLATEVVIGKEMDGLVPLSYMTLEENYEASFIL